jgi:stage III sporulation protein AC
MVMNVDVIFKIAAIGIVVTILNQVLIKAGREEQAMLTTLVGVIVVLTMVINLVTNLFDTVKTMFQLY